MENDTDDTEAYERWMAERYTRGSVVFRHMSTPTPCEFVVNGMILDRIQSAPKLEEA